jgi:CRP/FNR family transcriptional regulator
MLTFVFSPLFLNPTYNNINGLCLDLGQNAEKIKKIGPAQKGLFMTILSPVVSGIPLFSGLADHYLAKIESLALTKTFARGEMIFSEGDEGDGFYVVVEGQVKIFKSSAEGKEKILHIFGPGEPFGEVPVFTGRAFPATAVALAKSKLLFFPKSAFLDLIAKNPSLALAMLGVLSMRLREFTDQIENLALKEVPGRLASYLLLASKERGYATSIDLEISKGQLASLLGTIPETLSRIFSKMSSRGLIEVDGKTIRLLDLGGIEELAESGRI